MSSEKPRFEVGDNVEYEAPDFVEGPSTGKVLHHCPHCREVVIQRSGCGSIETIPDKYVEHYVLKQIVSYGPAKEDPGVWTPEKVREVAAELLDYLEPIRDDYYDLVDIIHEVDSELGQLIPEEEHLAEPIILYYANAVADVMITKLNVKVVGLHEDFQ